MNKKILSVVLILCVMLAVMPMTAYAADIAFCTKCNKIQTVRVTYQYADNKVHKCSLTCTVCYNKWYYAELQIRVWVSSSLFCVQAPQSWSSTLPEKKVASSAVPSELRPQTAQDL